MIFVTLGTQDKTFERLLEAVEKLKLDEKIIAQTGSTNFKSNKMEIHNFLSPEEFNRCMKEAKVVITHAGVGTIIQGLNLHKKMIVAARKKEYKEHVNDHQEQILRTFASSGYIIPLDNFNDLEKLIEKDFTPKEYKSNNKQFIENLDNEIKNLLKK